MRDPSSFISRACSFSTASYQSNMFFLYSFIPKQKLLYNKRNNHLLDSLQDSQGKNSMNLYCMTFCFFCFKKDQCKLHDHPGHLLAQLLPPSPSSTACLLSVVEAVPSPHLLTVACRSFYSQRPH
jgi:hypothetical protein